MAITDKLSDIADAMRGADGSSRTYNMVEMAQRPAVWQQTIAEAITAKGVDTMPESSFDVMAANIGLISGGGGDCIAYTKEVTLSSTQTLLASLQELVDAGFISNDTTDPGQIWKNYDVILVRKQSYGNPNNVITESRASSHPVTSSNTNRLYYKNALRVNSSNYSAIGTTETITSNTAGYISIGTSGLIVTTSSSFAYNGDYVLLIYASGKK